MLFCGNGRPFAEKVPWFGSKKAGRGSFPSGQMKLHIRFIAGKRKNIANYPGNLTLNSFTNAKRITHALYQNMGDEVAPHAAIDTIRGMRKG